MKKLSLDEVTKRSNKTHNNKYDYSKSVYKNAVTAMTITCPDHGDFDQIPYFHMKGSQCPKCIGKNLTTKEYVSSLIKVHGTKFDYSKVEYKGAKKPITIICRTHGEFIQNAEWHKSGNGCPKCSGKKKTKDDFISESSKIHNNKYDYSLINYINLGTKVNIICKDHGEFMQTPGNHLRGQGCRKCGKERSGLAKQKSTEDFITEAREIHGDMYDYSKSSYTGAFKKVIIGCGTHGYFSIPASNHTNARLGCPKCSNRISKGETAWLNHLKIEKRQYKIILDDSLKFVDGYDPDTNTVYLYHGDYWHGNPNKFNPGDINTKAGKTYGELYRDTLQYEKELQYAGYRVISIWESEWNKIKPYE